MPKISLAVMEAKARDYFQSLNQAEDRRYVRVLAKEGKRRLEKFAHEPTEQEVLEMFRTITYTDPVGDEVAACLDGHKACRNHEDHAPFHANAARRCSPQYKAKVAAMPGSHLQ